MPLSGGRYPAEENTIKVAKKFEENRTPMHPDFLQRMIQSAGFRLVTHAERDSISQMKEQIRQLEHMLQCSNDDIRELELELQLVHKEVDHFLGNK